VTDRNEEGLKKALKTLVQGEPQKLMFFNGLDKDAAIPGFVPKSENIERRRRHTSKRKRYTFGMAASSAACLIFVLLTAFNTVQETPDVSNESENDSALQFTPVKSAQDIAESARAGAGLDGGADVSASVPLFLIAAIACAAAFVILLLIKHKALSRR